MVNTTTVCADSISPSVCKFAEKNAWYYKTKWMKYNLFSLNIKCTVKAESA